MDTEAAAGAWIEGWKRAWLAEDPDGVAALYADEAVFRTHPFREAQRASRGAREYAVQAFGDETALDVWFGEPVVGGGRAAVEWWAILEADGGRLLTLAGASVLRFGDDGRCVDQRDYWSMEEGRRERPTPWGV